MFLIYWSSSISQAIWPGRNKHKPARREKEKIEPERYKLYRNSIPSK